MTIRKNVETLEDILKSYLPHSALYVLPDLKKTLENHIKKECDQSYNDGKEDMQRKYEII